MSTNEYATFSVSIGDYDPVEVRARTRRHALVLAVYQLMTVHDDFSPDCGMHCIITEKRND